MNLLQIIRKARFAVDAIRTGDVTSALWGDEEMVDLTNTAMDEAAKIIRLADSRILSKTLVSTGGIPYGSGQFGGGSYSDADLVSESYTLPPIAAETTDYLLPPDFVRVVSIRPTDVAFQAVVFRPMNAQDKYFLDQRSIPSADLISSSNSNQTLWYTLVGPRGIRFTPTPKDAINIEMVYDFRAPKLLYAGGSMSITNGAVALSGSGGTTWFTSGLRTPAELLPGITSLSQVRIDRIYPGVASITSDSAAVMTRAWQSSTLTNSSSLLAMVPQLPEEHHAWLAEMTAALMMKKVNTDTATKMMTDLTRQLKEMVQPEITVRQIQESIPVEPFETHRM